MDLSLAAMVPLEILDERLLHIDILFRTQSANAHRSSPVRVRMCSCIAFWLHENDLTSALNYSPAPLRAQHSLLTAHIAGHAACMLSALLRLFMRAGRLRMLFIFSSALGRTDTEIGYLPMGYAARIPF